MALIAHGGGMRRYLWTLIGMALLAGVARPVMAGDRITRFLKVEHLKATTLETNDRLRRVQKGSMVFKGRRRGGLSTAGGILVITAPTERQLAKTIDFGLHMKLATAWPDTKANYVVDIWHWPGKRWRTAWKGSGDDGKPITQRLALEPRDKYIDRETRTIKLRVRGDSWGEGSAFAVHVARPRFGLTFKRELSAFERAQIEANRPKKKSPAIRVHESSGGGGQRSEAVNRLTGDFKGGFEAE